MRNAKLSALKSAECCRSEKLDKHIAIVLDGQSAKYILKVDAPHFHRISAHYYCTDSFLSSFLAALICPATKGARARVLAHMKGKFGWSGYLLPSDWQVFTSLAKETLQHRVVQVISEECRQGVDKTIIGIDGQWSPLLSVKHQVRHGRRKHGATEDPDAAKVLLSVQCFQAVLLVKVAPFEGVLHQASALKEAVGRNGVAEVRLVFSDAPEQVDSDTLFAALPNAEAIAKDPLHIALSVEGGSGEKVTGCSTPLRRCLVKFKMPCDDGRPFFRKGFTPVMEALTLAAAMEHMNGTEAAKVIKRIEAQEYPDAPYADAAQFLRDIAAIAKSHPDAMSKRLKEKGKDEHSGTVRGSLSFAVRPQGLEYLMNGPRFFARNPTVQSVYGTTRNEAFHRQLKGYWRIVRVSGIVFGGVFGKVSGMSLGRYLGVSLEVSGDVSGGYPGDFWRGLWKHLWGGILGWYLEGFLERCLEGFLEGYLEGSLEWSLERSLGKFPEGCLERFLEGHLGRPLEGPLGGGPLGGRGGGALEVPLEWHLEGPLGWVGGGGLCRGLWRGFREGVWRSLWMGLSRGLCRGFGRCL